MNLGKKNIKTETDSLASSTERYGTLEPSDFEEAKEGAKKPFSIEKYSEIKKYVSEGGISFRMVGIVASMCLIASSVASVVLQLLSYNIFAVLMNLFVVLIGVTSAICEYDVKVLPFMISNYISSELHLITTPIGRSVIYTIMGIVLVTQAAWFQVIAGLLIMLVGLFIFYYMRAAGIALYEMRSHIADETQLRVVFDHCDKDKNGVLDSTEGIVVLLLKIYILY